MHVRSLHCMSYEEEELQMSLSHQRPVSCLKKSRTRARTRDCNEKMHLILTMSYKYYLIPSARLCAPGRKGGERTSSASCTRRSEKVIVTYKKAIKKPAKQP
jgi:hypothetical protein